MAGRSVILAALAAALPAAAALAADPPAPSGAQPRICRGGEHRLGTRTRTPRRCLTAEQWRLEEEERGQLPVTLQVTQGQNDGRQSAAPR